MGLTKLAAAERPAGRSVTIPTGEVLASSDNEGCTRLALTPAVWTPSAGEPAARALSGLELSARGPSHCEWQAGPPSWGSKWTTIGVVVVKTVRDPPLPSPPPPLPAPVEGGPSCRLPPEAPDCVQKRGDPAAMLKSWSVRAVCVFATCEWACKPTRGRAAPGPHGHRHPRTPVQSCPSWRRAEKCGP